MTRSTYVFLNLSQDSRRSRVRVPLVDEFQERSAELVHQDLALFHAPDGDDNGSDKVPEDHQAGKDSENQKKTRSFLRVRYVVVALSTMEQCFKQVVPLFLFCQLIIC